MRHLSVLKQTAKMLRRPTSGILALAVVSAIVTQLTLSGIAAADQYDQQINQLRAENNALQSDRQKLQAEANDLQSVIDGLQSQITALENQIRDNENRRSELERKIAELQIELNKQRELLGKNVRAMYLEDDMSAFEMLASSKNLSDYVDREQYRISVENKIQAALEKINDLQAELDKQKSDVEKLLADQKDMQAQLNEQRAEQARLLALNQSERTALDNEIRANSSRISQLRNEQAAQNRRLFGGNLKNIPDTSGYPWANVPFPNSLVDPWGMYKRQCVSYTAWKVWRTGRHMPYWGGRGNANRWDDNARAAGIPVDNKPRAGDIAISNAGYYGHAMYVEHVYGDGTIYISQYNGSWDGRYSEARISAAGLAFIHF